MRNLLAAALISCVLSGCIAARTTWKSLEFMPPVTAEEPVPLYLAKTAPAWVRQALVGLAAADDAVPWGAAPVAEIEAKSGLFGSYGTMVDGVRDAARDLGADTIVASGTADYDPAQVVFFRLMRRAPVSAGP